MQTTILRLAIIVSIAVTTTVLVLGRSWSPPTGGPDSTIEDWARYLPEKVHIGTSQAPVKMIVFIDYTCQYCKEMARNVTEIYSLEHESVAIRYRHFPLSDGVPRDAALAAICAERQDSFLEAHRVLFENSDRLRSTAPSEFVRDIVPDAASFTDCLQDPEAMRHLAYDLRDGYELGLEGTPATLFNDWLYRGLLAAHEVAAVVRARLGHD